MTSLQASATLRNKPFAWPLVFVLIAATIYVAARSKRDLTDFNVYLIAAERVLAGEPLYRDTDGFYQFKYLPAFALFVSPLTWLPAEAAKVLWFAAMFGLVLVFVERSIRMLPDR